LSRRRAAALAAAWALPLLAGGCGGSAGGDHADYAGHLPPPGRLFGFSDQTFTYTGVPQSSLNQGVSAARELADARAAGANSARIVVSWWNLEPQRGFFNPAYVARLKGFTDRLERVGGRVLLQLGVPPPWASAAPNDPRATIGDRPDLIRAFARYAGYVARTWPRAAAIETWNEPNTVYFWRPRPPEPALYVRMHRAAARAIRRAEPKLKVITAGLLATSVGTPSIMAPGTFLRRAYAAGLRPADYDALAYHPYPAQVDGGVETLDGGAFLAGLQSFRSGYQRADPKARVWITETGVSTSGNPATGEVASPAAQAAGIKRLVRRLLGLPEVDALFLHKLYDVNSEPASSRERGFGVMTSAGTRPGRPKPAFCVLRALTRPRAGIPGCRP
jgi:hypothetical protein